MSALSQQQFAEKAAETISTKGGVSMRYPSGRGVRKGVMVSQHGTEQIVPGIAQPSDVAGFVQHHEPALRSTGRYLGGWVEGPETYLDISRRHAGMREGIRAGQEHGQQAVYEVERDRSVDPFGAGIRYRGTLLEHLSRNERRRVSRSNSDLRRQSARQRLGRQFDPAPVSHAETMQQLRLRGLG